MGFVARSGLTKRRRQTVFLTKPPTVFAAQFSSTHTPNSCSGCQCHRYSRPSNRRRVTGKTRAGHTGHHLPREPLSLVTSFFPGSGPSSESVSPLSAQTAFSARGTQMLCAAFVSRSWYTPLPPAQLRRPCYIVSPVYRGGSRKGSIDGFTGFGLPFRILST